MAYTVKAKKAKTGAQQPDILPSKAPVADTWHGTLITWVNEADDTTTDSRELSERSRDYYDSKQISSADAAKLKQRRQPPIVINRIKPKIDALMGMEKAAKTTAKAYPRTPKHTKSAEAATEGIRFVLQDNAFDQIRSAVWEHILIEGTGGCEVIAEDMGEGEEVRITLNPIMWDRIIYDPHSRKKDFSDARYLGQVVWMDYDEAAALYPNAKDVLESMQSGSSTYEDKPRWMDNTRRRVKIVELYYWKDGECWYACFTRGGYCKDPQVSPYKNEEGETEWPYEFASAFVDREGGRYGAVRQLLDVQDEINKRREKALHLMSVRQTFGTQGAVPDVNKARKELAKPDGHLEVAYGEFGKDFGILPTSDMLQAQFNLLTESKLEIDSVGANAATQGKDHSVQSGRALIERRNAGQTEVGPMFDVLRYWQSRVFRKIWNRIRQYWKAERWIRVTDDEHNLRWVGLNAPVTKGQLLLEQAQEKGLPPDQMAMLQQQISQDPSMQETVKTNDVAELDVDIIVSEVPDVLTQQIEDFQVLGEMVKSGFPLPPKAVIEASPLANKDRILKMMDEAQAVPPQVQQQMKQMKEAGDKLAEENQKLKADLQQAKADQSTDQAKVAADMQAKQAELAMKAQIQQQEIELEQAKAAAEIQLEREKAAAQIEIEKMKAGAAAEIQAAKVSADRQTQVEKLEFDRQCRQEDRAAENEEKAGEDGKAVIPQLEKLVEMVAETVKMVAQMAQKSMETQEKPRQVSFSDIKIEDGSLKSVVVTPNLVN